MLKVRNKKGFTLVELLLVVAILGFLIAIVAVAAGKISEDAKVKAMSASLKTVKTALEVYYTQHSKYPDVSGWDGYLTGETNRIIDRVPEDTFRVAGTAVTYDLDTGGRPTYTCYSYGVDGADGTPTLGIDTCDFGSTDDIFITNAKSVTGTNFVK